MQTALAHASLPATDPYRPGSLFSPGQPSHVDDLFREVGFQDVATTTRQELTALYVRAGFIFAAFAFLTAMIANPLIGGL
jgi:hypothetical protein